MVWLLGLLCLLSLLGFALLCFCLLGNNIQYKIRLVLLPWFGLIYIVLTRRVTTCLLACSHILTTILAENGTYVGELKVEHDFLKIVLPTVILKIICHLSNLTRF